MRQIAETVRSWIDARTDVALAIVVDVEGSAPRPVGTTMAVTADGSIVGNVSAGCVDGAVVTEALAVLDGDAPRVVEFGISDDAAMAVGLTCGGGIRVLIVRIASSDTAVRELLDRVLIEEPVALAVLVEGPGEIGAVTVVAANDSFGTCGNEGLDVAVTADARGFLATATTAVRRYGPRGGRRRDDVAVLVHCLAPPPRMLVFGAIDFATALAELGSFLGYRVTVCDARAAFATPLRFPHVDDLVVEWPHRYLQRVETDANTVICVLTHDPKFDVPLLHAALQTPARYIGVMGSRRRQDDLLTRLRAEGVSPADLERLRAPVGLDLGARTPAETAVSIAAEVIALRWDGTGRPLREMGGAIHRQRVSV